MISQDGAALIASLIPVAMLIIALEARQAGSFTSTASWRNNAKIFGAVVIVLALFAGFFAEVMAVKAVASENALDGKTAALTAVGAYATGGLATLILVLALASSTGLSLPSSTGRSLAALWARVTRTAPASSANPPTQIPGNTLPGSATTTPPNESAAS